jgi:protein-S-isoprenylcysteine O-methyltransferase Ste14
MTTTNVTTVSGASTTPTTYAERLRDPLYWAWVRFVVFGRAVPVALFSFMGYLQWGHLRGAVSAVRPGSGIVTVLGQVLPGALYLGFCCIPVGIYLTRPMPRTRDGRLVARSAAFTGTLMQLIIGAVLPTQRLLFTPPAFMRGLSTALSIVAFAFAIAALAYLRHSLSIIPEARRLATGGPYGLVRHPLYLAEISASVALVMSSPHLIPTLALGAFIGVQMVRARFEERLLAATFTDYAAYARRTRRLIPFLW